MKGRREDLLRGMERDSGEGRGWMERDGK